MRERETRVGSVIRFRAGVEPKTTWPGRANVQSEARPSCTEFLLKNYSPATVQILQHDWTEHRKSMVCPMSSTRPTSAPCSRGHVPLDGGSTYTHDLGRVLALEPVCATTRARASFPGCVGWDELVLLKPRASPGTMSSSSQTTAKHALLAQLAEQLTLNQRVVGSSPTGGTPKNPPRDEAGFFISQDANRLHLRLCDTLVRLTRCPLSPQTGVDGRSEPK